MAKSTIFNIFNDLVNAAKNAVAAKYIFLKDRPKSINADSQMEKFIVVDLPTDIDDLVAGKKKAHLFTAGVFYLFTKAKNDGTLNVNATGDFVEKVVDIFPISGEHFAATNPVVRMDGGDDQGFQVTTVTFDIHTR